jgi:hypothetical protein
MLHGLEALRGYTPLDNRRYKEYLQFIADSDRSLIPMDKDNPLAWPVIRDFHLVNRPLIDLLGVRYLIQPSGQAIGQEGWHAVFQDSQPIAYDFVKGGVRDLPPYTIYENAQVMERAFIVPHAAPLPPRDEVLKALKQTDFHRTVLLEMAEAEIPDSKSGDFGYDRPAAIRSYQPNRVVVDVDDGPAGFLILTDLWYPGWNCTVDGVPRPIHRANFLFRAVEMPAGRHEVVFTFAPVSYQRGRLISIVGLVLAGSVLGLGAALRWRQAALNSSSAVAVPPRLPR